MHHRLLGFLDALVFPICAACDRHVPLGPGPPLCVSCRDAWPEPAAQPALPGLEPLLAPWPYQGPVQNVVRRAKASPRGPEGIFLGRRLLTFVRGTGCLPGALVAVPAHRRRRRRHLANELAACLRSGLRWPRGPTLRRRVDRAPQASLGGAARRRNLAGTFRADLPWGFQAPPRVWVVDDVATTGATLREAARALRAAGVAEVGGIVLARVTGPLA